MEDLHPETLAGTNRSDWSRTAIAGDLLAVVRHLDGPAVLVGHSISDGAVTIAAAQEPELVTALVELAPFTRAQSCRPSDLRATLPESVLRLGRAGLLRSRRAWRAYLEIPAPTCGRPAGRSRCSAPTPSCATRDA